MTTPLRMRIALYVARFLHLQLFVTLISLPILVAWGLPLSLLSPLGNLIFAPVLTLFLTLSSLIFFLELLHIPNTAVIWLLEQVSAWWLYSMSFCSSWVLVGFVRPSPLFLLGVPAAACAIALSKHLKRLEHSIACMSALLLFACLYLRMIAAPITHLEDIQCNNGTVTLVAHHQTTVVIDPGVIAQRASAAAWLEYTLLAHITKTTGATVIDHLILLRPSPRLFEAVEQLCAKGRIKHLYIPLWQGKLPGSGHRHMAKLKETAQKNKTVLHRLCTQEKTIYLKNNAYLSLEPADHTCKGDGFTYPALRVTANVCGQEKAVKTII